VALSAQSPANFQTTFSEGFGSNEISSIPIEAGQTKDIKVKVTPPRDVKAGDYPVLVKVASTYFDLADDFLTDKAKRQAAYEAGAKAAKQAFQLDESNADAHFFHAVNLGNAARLQGSTKGALVVNEIKSCLGRAIEINPKHAQALQMMGGMLLELPGFLGGSEKKAQEYLERAIAADGNYANARILVATLYRKQGRIENARKQLEAVIQAEHPHYRFTWERKYKPEAERILKELTRKSSP
jgi:tetratricopeptide (TPR) repeat protein